MNVAVADPSQNVWEPQRAMSLRQARRRSRLVLTLRRAFVAGAGASLASVFVFMGLSAIEGGLGASLRSQVDPQRMVAPRFTGRTESGGPFQITAETAIRQGPEQRTVHLDSPVYRAEDGTLVVAPNGIYDEGGKTISLNGDVLFSERSGNRFSSPNMIIDLEGGAVHGEGGVTGAGPLGVVRANAYEIRENGRTLVLRGDVRGQIPDRRAAETPTP